MTGTGRVSPAYLGTAVSKPSRFRLVRCRFNETSWVLDEGPRTGVWETRPEVEAGQGSGSEWADRLCTRDGKSTSPTTSRVDTHGSSSTRTTCPSSRAAVARGTSPSCTPRPRGRWTWRRRARRRRGPPRTGSTTPPLSSDGRAPRHQVKELASFVRSVRGGLRDCGREDPGRTRTLALGRSAEEVERETRRPPVPILRRPRHPRPCPAGSPTPESLGAPTRT